MLDLVLHIDGVGTEDNSNDSQEGVIKELGGDHGRMVGSWVCSEMMLSMVVVAVWLGSFVISQIFCV